MVKATKATLTVIYERLWKAFGPQKWWPAQTRFEVIVGAILTQNTNWGNVEKALKNLKGAKLLSPQALHHVSTKKLAQLIRPAGYFNVKAKRLKNFVLFLMEEYNGNLTKISREDWQLLRGKFLDVNGIGPETADSILLYAFNKPVFVIDAYTKRVFYRHNMADKNSGYHDLQKMVMDSLDHSVEMFNEYHALIVYLGKHYCKPKPNCENCVLNSIRYSLVNKCHICHRALITQADRDFPGKGNFCHVCHQK